MNQENRILLSRRRLVILMTIIVTFLLLGRTVPVRSAETSEQINHRTHQPGSSPQQSDQETQLWTCSMHPHIRLPKPGKCPICGMTLIPLQNDPPSTSASVPSLRELKLSPAAEKLAEIQTQPVVRKFVPAQIRMVGKVEYDETRVATITAWVPGRIDRLYVDFTGTLVKKGDPMVYLYSPELLSAQQELLQAIRTTRQLSKSGLDTIKRTARATITAARDKLRLWGFTQDQIDSIIRRGKPSDHMTILAPISGVVIHKKGLEGMYVKTGTPIYTIADLTEVWVKLDAYESDIIWLREGQSVNFTTVAYPGEFFTGIISFIDPFLDPKTRTVKVRINVANEDGKLKPDIFVRAVVEAYISADGRIAAKPTAGMKPPPIIPATAPLITGRRAVVYLAVAGKPGTYQGREIVLGPRTGNYYVVKNGLSEGDKVVTHGNFKIDSAIQIMAKPSMMTPEGGGGGGMHHAGMSGTKKTNMKPAGSLDVPQSFKMKLKPIIRIYNTITDKLKARDFAGARKAYGELKQAVKAVDMKLVTGHPHMVWMELAMLLENDAIVGEETYDPKDALDNYKYLTRHIQRLQQQFGLDRQENKGKKISPIMQQSLSPELQKQLTNLLDAYLSVQAALASDQFEQAKLNMMGLKQAFEAGDMKLFQGKSLLQWMAILKNLNPVFDGIAETENLEALRPLFAAVSENMAKIIETFGVPGNETLYELSCPMVFNNKGAIWLQKDKQVRNPYYGTAMLSCGDVKRAFSAEGHRSEKGALS